MNEFSAMEFLKKRKEKPTGTCISCKNFYVEDNIEVCLSSDKFLIPEFHPYNCSRYEKEVVE